MHRRMSLGFALMLLLVCLAGAVPASAEPLAAAKKAPVIGSFELLDWAWEWLTSLVSDVPDSGEGGEALNEIDGGAFIDPLGSGGNG